jgi:magnesium transporter
MGMNPMQENAIRDGRLEYLHEALSSGTLRQVRRLIKALNPAEIADFLESLPMPQREVAWKLVDADDEGDVLVEVNDEVRNSLIRSMDSDELVAAATSLDIDDMADLLAELPEAVNREVLRSLDQSDRLRLEAVLSHNEDSAGGLMDPDTITVRGDVTVEVILRYLRMRREIPAGTDAVFVVGRTGRYLGCLLITRLLTADPESTAHEVMDEEIPAIHASTNAADVATLFENYDLVSAPVIDDDGMLIGRITVDDVVDVIREEASHSVLSMAGLDEEDDMFAPVFFSARRRAVWLGINLATACLASGVAYVFESTLDAVVWLAVLMPIVPSMGGIAGSQTLILITRGMALGQIKRTNAVWLLKKEFGVGLINGLIWAAVVGLLVSVVAREALGTYAIGLVIAGALLINLVSAAAAGFFVPLTLKRFGVDPALAGGVVLTTITDVVGLGAFLGLGALILL